MKKITTIILFFTYPLLAVKNEIRIEEQNPKTRPSKIITKLTFPVLIPERLFQKFRKNVGHDDRFYPIKELDIKFQGNESEFSHLKNYLIEHGRNFNSKVLHNIGIFYLQQDNLKKAKTILQTCANKGLVKSMYILGTDKKLKEENEITQITWLQKAAAYEHLQALFLLAQQYKKTDEEKHISYLKQAIKAGYPLSRQKLQKLLKNHPQISTEIDWVKVYQNEAKAGFSKAFKRLAKYYMEKDEELVQKYKSIWKRAKKIEKQSKNF